MKYLTRMAYPLDKPVAQNMQQYPANNTYNMYGPGTIVFYPDTDGYVKHETYNFGGLNLNNTNAAKVKEGQPFIFYQDNYTDYFRATCKGVYRRLLDGGYYAT